MPAVPPLPRHQEILGKLVFLKENTAVLCVFQNTEAALPNPSFSYFHRDVALSSTASSSSWTQGSLGFRSASFG